jgi:hypothetical protein
VNQKPVLRKDKTHQSHTQPLTPLSKTSSVGLKVSTGSLQAARSYAHTLDNHRLTIDTRNLDINTIRAKPSRVLKEVVRLPGRRLPGFASICRHLQLAYTDICIHNLHAEPELACAGLVLQHNRRRDAARDKVPADFDYALGRVGELLEGVGVQVKVVGSAAYS